MSSGKCREILFGELRSYPCANKAVTAAGYCRVHDPELQAARREKAPPPKDSRRRIARQQLDEFLKAKLSPEDYATALRGVQWGYCDWVTPPVDVDIHKGGPKGPSAN